MNPLQKVDGMKTATAGGLSIIPAFMSGLNMIWHFPPIFSKIQDSVVLFIGVLGAIGVTHKIAKYMASKGLE